MVMMGFCNGGVDKGGSGDGDGVGRDGGFWDVRGGVHRG